MNGINDYLNQLQLDKQTLVDTLNAKGVEASNEETFTSLVPKVSNIQNGENLSEYFAEVIPYDINVPYGWGNAIKKLPPFIFNGTNANSLFRYCKAEEINLSNFDTTNTTTMSMMFRECSNVKELDLSSFNTSNVTNMSNIFHSCYYLENLILGENFDTSKVTAMDNMFYGCGNLQNINEIINSLNGSANKTLRYFYAYIGGVGSSVHTPVPNLNITTFDTSNVTDMSMAFQSSKQIKNVVLNFDTKKTTNMSTMFSSCDNLTNLDISNFSFESCYNISGIFSGCPNLTNLVFGKNLGIGYSTSQNANYASYTLNLSASSLITEESLISVLNGLADIATKGCNIQSCILGETNLAKLTSEEGQAALAQATSYGWAIS